MKITTEKSTKKLEFKNITIREPLVEDILEAHKYGNDVEIGMALISQICTFDGKQLTIEDVRKLPVSVFLELSAGLDSSDILGSVGRLSSLSEKVASGMAK